MDRKMRDNERYHNEIIQRERKKERKERLQKRRDDGSHLLRHPILLVMLTLKINRRGNTATGSKLLQATSGQNTTRLVSIGQGQKPIRGPDPDLGCR